MHGTPLGNGHGWSTSEKQVGWSSLEDGGRRRRGGWLTGWVGRFEEFRENRRRPSRLIPTFTREAPLHRSTLLTPPLSNSTLRFVLLCSLWYMSSAMSSNTGKAILNQFRYPVTLTFVQFGFVAGYCLLFTSPLIRFTRIRSPTRAIVRNTAPMAVFQVGGHIFSSVAIARVPVSTVHTIKVCFDLCLTVSFS
jgi:solute carrier family 35 protein E1